jgi:hypothetical protein
MLINIRRLYILAVKKLEKTILLDINKIEINNANFLEYQIDFNQKYNSNTDKIHKIAQASLVENSDTPNTS